MAHEIWSKRFYSRGDKPAWHRISIFDGSLEVDKDYTAGEMLEVMDSPEIIEQELFAEYPGFDKHGVTLEIPAMKKLSTGYKALIRKPVPDDPKHNVLGVVSNGYELITPAHAAQIWDDKVGLTVETMAFLKGGSKLFITGKLPSFDIGNEQIDNYLILNNPMDGKGAAGGYVSSVRVVCANTLSMATTGAKNYFRIRHYEGCRQQLAKWMAEVYVKAQHTTDVMKEAYDIMIKEPYTDTQMKEAVTKIYPVPNLPNHDIPRKATWEETMGNWEYRRAWNERARDTVEGLWKGGGTGYNSEVAGTQWWAYNAFCELETWRKGTSASMALNGIDGDRATNMQRAHRVITTGLS